MILGNNKPMSQTRPTNQSMPTQATFINQTMQQNNQIQQTQVNKTEQMKPNVPTDKNIHSSEGLTNFDRRFNDIKHNAELHKDIIKPTNEKASSMVHSDVMNKDEMKDKSFAILQERLDKGTITVEEFSKKCAELGNK